MSFETAVIRQRFLVFRRRLRPWLLGAALYPVALRAHAEPSPSQRAEAAREFDSGVRLFDEANYVSAARAFLRADAMVPNSEAVTNAIAAARRANDHLLVVEATERGMERGDGDPALAAKARLALAESVKHLTRLQLDCEPAPCELALDGARVASGARYVLPGTHRMQATGPAEAIAEEVLTLSAGTMYRIVLHPRSRGDTQAAADVSAEPHTINAASDASDASNAGDANIASDAIEPSDANLSRTEMSGDATEDKAATEEAGLSPAWFYAGAAVTAVLVGATTWSGIDTLSATADLSDPAPPDERAAAKDKILRTDILLTASIVAAAATTYLGLFVVDWNGTRATTALLPVHGGTMLATQGRF